MKFLFRVAVISEVIKARRALEKSSNHLPPHRQAHYDLLQHLTNVLLVKGKEYFTFLNKN